MENWSERDLDELDAKFDALCEYLGVQFVFEKICDGSENADQERVYIRPKTKRPAEIPTQMPTKYSKKRKGYNY